MSQYDELKRLAEHHLSLGHAYTVATPTAVLALIAENERLEVEVKRMTSIAYAAHGAFRMETLAERDQLKAENAGLKTGYEAYERVNAELRAEVEALRATAGLQTLLPEVSDALEELELHGLHGDQGYRKLKDWYRKVGLACRVIQGPMFGAEHGELVSQNTWLRSVVEHYAQQHAPVEPIPDMDGWSARLPGYDLPALLRDAKRYRHARDSAYSANTIEGHVLLVEFPMPEKTLRSAAQYLDAAIDADMGREVSNG